MGNVQRYNALLLNKLLDSVEEDQGFVLHVGRPFELDFVKTAPRPRREPIDKGRIVDASKTSETKTLSNAEG